MDKVLVNFIISNAKMTVINIVCRIINSNHTALGTLMFRNTNSYTCIVGVAVVGGFLFVATAAAVVVVASIGFLTILCNWVL